MFSPKVLDRANTIEFRVTAGELSEDAFFAFLCSMLVVLRSFCKPSALIYCCIDWRSITALNVAARLCGLALYTIAVWTKTNGGMGGIYRNAHEFVCVVMNRRGNRVADTLPGKLGGKFATQ